MIIFNPCQPDANRLLGPARVRVEELGRTRPDVNTPLIQLLEEDDAPAFRALRLRGLKLPDGYYDMEQMVLKLSYLNVSSS